MPKEKKTSSVLLKNKKTNTETIKIRISSKLDSNHKKLEHKFYRKISTKQKRK